MAGTTLTGNLAGVPDLRFTPSGVAVSDFTVVENRRKRDADGKWVDDEPLFMRCTAWSDLAANIASLGKGQRVTVTGTLKPETWEKDGVRHREVRLVAEDVAVSLRFAAYPQQAGAVY